MLIHGVYFALNYLSLIYCMKELLIYRYAKVRSVSGLVMQASGNLVEVDILELSRFSCSGVGICFTSIGLVLMVVKEIDLKLTQGMAEKR